MEDGKKRRAGKSQPGRSGSKPARAKESTRRSESPAKRSASGPDRERTTRDSGKRPAASGRSRFSKTDKPARATSERNNAGGEKRNFRTDKPVRPTSDRSSTGREKRNFKTSDKNKDFEQGKTFNKNSRSDKREESPKSAFNKEKKDVSRKKQYVKFLRNENSKQQKKTAKPSKPSFASKENGIRLNKYIANSGVCSRRDADILIMEGAISVNGEVVTELGFKVGPNDVIKYNNKKLNPEKKRYVLLNKPKDFITTTDDPEERKTVMDLVKTACPERIFPVGRLDRNTTGLLLLTNDGELAETLTHPSRKVKKLYQAELDKPISREDLEKLANGVHLEDGPAYPDEVALVGQDKKIVGIEIHEGRNRIVRRMFEHLGYEVVRLDRVMYAGLTKKDLPRGHWRFLTDKEVGKLKGIK
ncbi:MAG: pseudouridine synthase [Cytophagaceae bacterium]